MDITARLLDWLATNKLTVFMAVLWLMGIVAVIYVALALACLTSMC